MKRHLDTTCAFVLWAAIALLATGLTGSALMPLLPFARAEACGLIANRLAYGAEYAMCVSGVLLWVWRGAERNTLGKYQLRPLDWREAVLQ